MLNEFLSPPRLRGRMAAWSMTLWVAFSTHAAPWDGVLEHYKSITNQVDELTWVTHFSRALAAEYATWSGLTNARSMQNLSDAFRQAKVPWRWGTKEDRQDHESARAFYYQSNGPGETNRFQALCVAGRDRNEWLWLHPIRPAESAAMKREEFDQWTITNSIAILGVLYFSNRVEIPPWLHGRVLQRNATNFLQVISPHEVEARLKETYSGPEVGIQRVAGPDEAGRRTFAFVPTKAVARPFDIEFTLPGAQEVVGTIQNLLIGDTWLLAGAPLVTSKSTNTNFVAAPNPLARLLSPRTQVAGRRQSTVPVHETNWANIDQTAPLLARSLAALRAQDPNTRSIPLGLIPISAGAAEIPAWRNWGVETTNEPALVESQWIYRSGQGFTPLESDASQGTNEVSRTFLSYQPGALFRGTLAPILWPAGGIAITGAVWIHGEWTATQSAPGDVASLATNYHNDLIGLISDWRAANGRPLRFVIAQARRPAQLRHRAQGQTDPLWQIQMAQFDAATNAGINVISMEGALTDEPDISGFDAIARNIHAGISTDPPPLEVTLSIPAQNTNVVALLFPAAMDANHAGLFLFSDAGPSPARRFLVSGSPRRDQPQLIHLALPLDGSSSSHLQLRYLGGLRTPESRSVGNPPLPIPLFSFGWSRSP
jgi:hypothetical protein